MSGVASQCPDCGASFRGQPPACPECGIELFDEAPDGEDEDCGCPFDYPYTCPACGHKRITNHCPCDGIQNPCPECGWTDPGKKTPLQALGWSRPQGEAERR